MTEQVKQSIAYDISADATALISALDKAQVKMKEQQDSQQGFVSSLAGGLVKVASVSVGVVSAFRTAAFILDKLNNSSKNIEKSISGFGNVAAKAAAGGYGEAAEKLAPAMDKAHKAAQKITKPLSAMRGTLGKIAGDTQRFTSALKGASGRIKDSAVGLNKMRRESAEIPKSFKQFSQSFKGVKNNYSAATNSARETRQEQEKTNAEINKSARFSDVFKRKLKDVRGFSKNIASRFFDVSKHTKTAGALSGKLFKTLGGVSGVLTRAYFTQEKLNRAFKTGLGFGVEALKNANLQGKAWGAVKNSVNNATGSLGGFRGVLGKVAGTTFGKLLIGVAAVTVAFKILKSTVGSIKANQKLAETLGISEVDTKRLSNSFRVIERDLKKTITALDEARKQSRGLNTTNLTKTIGDETVARLRNARDSSEALRIAIQRINEASTESERRIVTQLLLGQQLTESQIQSLQRLNDSQRTWGLSAEQIEGNSAAITNLTANWNEFKQSVSSNVFDQFKTGVIIPLLTPIEGVLGGINRGFSSLGDHWQKFTNYASGGQYAIPETLADTAKAAKNAALEIESIPDAMKGAFDALSGDLNQYKTAFKDIKKEFSDFAPEGEIQDLSDRHFQLNAIAAAMKTVNEAQTTDTSYEKQLETARQLKKVYDGLVEVGFESPRLDTLKTDIFNLATQAAAGLEGKTEVLIQFKAADGNAELEQVAKTALDGLRDNKATQLQIRVELEEAELQHKKDQAEQFWRDNPVKMRVTADLPQGLTSGGGFSGFDALGAT
jgi:methyl-accepting chemotaxis protein